MQTNNSGVFAVLLQLRVVSFVRCWRICAAGCVWGGACRGGGGCGVREERGLLAEGEDGGGRWEGGRGGCVSRRINLCWAN